MGNNLNKSWARKVNKNETFAPSQDSEAIIEALMTVMPKAKLYNLLIEQNGVKLAKEICSYDAVKAMFDKRPNLKVDE